MFRMTAYIDFANKMSGSYKSADELGETVAYNDQVLLTLYMVTT